MKKYVFFKKKHFSTNIKKFTIIVESVFSDLKMSIFYLKNTNYSLFKSFFDEEYEYFNNFVIKLRFD